MTPELKAKWIAALRSGKYEQGQDRLHGADGKFCCLGVLCDISGQEWFKIQNEDGLLFYCCNLGTDFLEDRGESLGLPREIHAKAHCLNDGTLGAYSAEFPQRSHTFAEIADWLETAL